MNGRLALTDATKQNFSRLLHSLIKGLERLNESKKIHPEFLTKADNFIIQFFAVIKDIKLLGQYDKESLSLVANLAFKSAEFYQFLLTKLEIDIKKNYINRGAWHLYKLHREHAVMLEKYQQNFLTALSMASQCLGILSANDKDFSNLFTQKDLNALGARNQELVLRLKTIETNSHLAEPINPDTLPLPIEHPKGKCETCTVLHRVDTHTPLTEDEILNGPSVAREGDTGAKRLRRRRILRKQLPKVGSDFVIDSFFTGGHPDVLMVGKHDQPYTATNENAYPKSFFDENPTFRGRPNPKLRDAIEAYMGLDEKGEYKAGSHILQMNRTHEALLDECWEVDRDISHLEELLSQVELANANRHFFAIFLRITPEQVANLSLWHRDWVVRNALPKLVVGIQNEKESIELLIRAKNGAIKDYLEEKGGIESFKTDIERLQTQIKNLQKDTQRLNEVSNAVNRVISRIAEQDFKVVVLATQLPKPRLHQGIEAGVQDMKLGEDEKKRELEHKDIMKLLLEGRDIDKVLVPPSSFVNANGKLWQTPVLTSDSATFDFDEMPKKTVTVKQPILDHNLQHAMQQYNGFRDRLRHLQEIYLEKNKIYDTLKAQLVNVDTDFIDSVDNFDLSEHTEDLIQITEGIRAYDFLSFSRVKPEKHRELIRLLELEDQLEKVAHGIRDQKKNALITELEATINAIYESLDAPEHVLVPDPKMETADAPAQKPNKRTRDKDNQEDRGDQRNTIKKIKAHDQSSQPTDAASSHGRMTQPTEERKSESNGIDMGSDSDHADRHQAQVAWKTTKTSGATGFGGSALGFYSQSSDTDLRSHSAEPRISQASDRP